MGHGIVPGAAGVRTVAEEISHASGRHNHRHHLILAGLLWILQGTNVLGGSAMSGKSEWLYIGVAVAIVGAVLTWWSRRRRA